ncbi:hypothetical protein PHISCL_00012 [Aspergillus sclerotialis]|uniref:Amine oxidase n=1 Tax=Aspergillus sclerotialis TaxID=2070753 RepID=A0A3A3A1Y3_9EURO|nr:hypothetical protein PHISCL_00012 [Aspergillus sclerotialis]
MPSEYDVAVVGGGMAGIIAARDLSLEGYSVVLLEGRNRLGGRTYMDKAFNNEMDLELGGGYVHWTQPHIWLELERYGLSINPPMEGDKAYWLANGAVHSGTNEDFLKVALPLLERFFADSRFRFPNPLRLDLVDNTEIEKQTIEDRIKSLNLSSYERDILEGALAGVIHSTKKQGVAQLLHATATYFGNYMAFFETAGAWSIQGGTRKLIQAIQAHSKAEVRLSTPVSSISNTGTGVVVTTRAGESINTRAVVVALPLNTLCDVKITPEVPPAARTMIERKNPVMAHKLWVRVKGEVEPFSIYAPAGKYPINGVRVEKRHNGDSVVLCMCSDAAAIDPGDIPAVQAALERFVPNIKVIDTACHNWVTDEFSKGGWMMHRPGTLTAGPPVLREPHGNTYFAGSDLSTREGGSIEGAVESGVRAARDVLERLRASSKRAARI